MQLSVNFIQHPLPVSHCVKNLKWASRQGVDGVHSVGDSDVSGMANLQQGDDGGLADECDVIRNCA